MKSNKIDILFKNKLERHDENVPSDAWSKIEAQLQAKKSKKAPITIKWYVAASITILLICTLGIYTNQNKQSENTFANSLIDLETENIAFNDNNKSSQLSDLPLAHNKLTKTTPTASYQKEIRKVDEQETVKEKNEIRSNIASSISLPQIEKKHADIMAIADLHDNITTVHKVNTKIIVEINFNPNQKSEFELNKNRIKSLASELSIADLRASKNELFASALNFDKKQLN